MEQKFLSASTLESQSVLQPARSTERLERPAGVVSESRSRLPPAAGLPDVCLAAFESDSIPSASA